jgi:endonuclease/exonuclease/phosphatase family metal-dependent hydrolase
MRIVSYNTNLSVPVPIRFNGAYERALRVADVLYRTSPNVDIICFQECIIHRETVMSRLTHHPYRSSPICASLLGNNIRYLSSGLVIASRWPLLEHRHRIFAGRRYHAEAAMAKAVQYARVGIPCENGRVRCVHVLNTHLQAWSNPTSRDIRAAQMQQIKIFIDSLQIPANEPVFLCGDFNLDFYEHHRAWDSLLACTNMQPLLPDHITFSVDPSTNTLVGADDSGEYRLEASGLGCYEDMLSSGICSCCPQQLIDGIMVSRGHLPIKSHVTHVLTSKTDRPFSAHINAFWRRFSRDVSDHYAVETCISIDYDTWPTHDRKDLSILLQIRERLKVGTSNDGSSASLVIIIATAMVSGLIWYMMRRSLTIPSPSSNQWQ